MNRHRLVLSIVALAGIVLTVGCASSATAGGGDRRQSAASEQQSGQIASAPPIGPTRPAAESSGNASSPPSPTTPGANNSARTAQPTPTTPNGAKEYVSSQKVGDLQVSLKVAPFPPSGRSATSLEVTLTNASGQAVSDAQVSLDLTMPAMPMPPNHPAAQPQGDGRYTASARMGMSGEWWVTVAIRRGAQQQAVKFTGLWVP
ncbi:MAG: FixH family protein [Chloroflexi bacterium]|nr:FixH family protein [Chloroflexota bacterium]